MSSSNFFQLNFLLSVTYPLHKSRYRDFRLYKCSVFASTKGWLNKRICFLQRASRGFSSVTYVSYLFLYWTLPYATSSNYSVYMVKRPCFKAIANILLLLMGYWGSAPAQGPKPYSYGMIHDCFYIETLVVSVSKATRRIYAKPIKIFWMYRLPRLHLLIGYQVLDNCPLSMRLRLPKCTKIDRFKRQISKCLGREAYTVAS